MSLQKAATILNVLNQYAQSQQIAMDPHGFLKATLSQQGASEADIAKADELLTALVAILESP